MDYDDISLCKIHGAYPAHNDDCPRCESAKKTAPLGSKPMKKPRAKGYCHYHNVTWLTKDYEECPECTKALPLSIVNKDVPKDKNAIKLAYPIVRHGVDILYVKQYKPKRKKTKKGKKDYDRFWYDNQWWSIFELWFYVKWQRTDLPMPTPELRFHPEREWRFDFCWQDFMIAVECEGGAFSGGRHTRGQGFTNDTEKYNEATALGWRVYRFPTQDDKHITFMEDRIKEAMERKETIELLQQRVIELEKAG